MTLNFDAVGTRLGPELVSWTDADPLLYAIAVGAGQDDALQELQWTTENSTGITPRTLPTFGVVVVQRAHLEHDLGPVDRTMVLHGEQSVTACQPLPMAGSALVTSTLSGVYDLGSGALAVVTSEATDPANAATILRCVSSSFIRGAGGFGGARPPSGSWVEPHTPPDQVITVGTRHDQALLYRLCVDRNPLHSDPPFARRAGFDRPILHGLCTFGVVARVLMREAAEHEPTRTVAFGARFSKPVVPGETLSVEVWRDGARTRFRARDRTGAAVLDRGELAMQAQ